MGGSDLYQAFREHGRPTYYGENRWPVTADKVVYGILYAFLAIAFSFYIIILGFRGTEKIYVFIRVTLSLFIGAVILICNFAYGWEYGSVKAVTQYKSFSTEQVDATVGLKVGLRGINVTLRANERTDDQKSNISLINETVNYNEQFSWEWAQGKPGFGEDAGRLRREYRAAQWKGLPYPILWVVEYFTVDEGNFRHGRYHRLAGWYCHIALWMAFPMWLLSNILFFMVIRYGAYYLSVTGGCLLLTNILYATIRNAVPLDIRFQSKSLTLHYGWCFWLVLFTGLLCELLVAIIIFMDLRFPEEICVFFGTDILQDYEDYYADPAELGLTPPEVVSSGTSTEYGAIQILRRPNKEVYTLRKRTVSTRFQRESARRPQPTPRKYNERGMKGQTMRASELPIYENVSPVRFDAIKEESSKSESSETLVLTEMKNSCE